MRQNENKRIDKDENGLEDRVVAIKRVTKVVKGGRNMRFSALVVVGDGNGHVGAGLGKAAEIPEAIRKGKEDAQKHMISVARTDYNSVTHDTYGKFVYDSTTNSYNTIKLSVMIWLEGWDADYIMGISAQDVNIKLGFEVKKSN